MIRQHQKLMGCFSAALAAPHWLRAPGPAKLAPPSSLQSLSRSSTQISSARMTCSQATTRSGSLPSAMTGGGGESWSVGQRVTLMTPSLVEMPLLKSPRLKVPKAQSSPVLILSRTTTCRNQLHRRSLQERHQRCNQSKTNSKNRGWRE